MHVQLFLLVVLFLRRLINLTKGLQKPHHKKRLNKDARADLEAWSIFIEHFNGKGLIAKRNLVSSYSLHMYTDASNIGFGGFLGMQWFAHKWSSDWLKLHISVRELYPIVLALELWAEKLEHKHVKFHCDNSAVVYCINKQTAKDPGLMKLIRRLVVQALKFNIVFEASYIPTLKNVLADKLSRFQIAEFKKLAPQMEASPTDVSHLLQEP